MMRVIWDFFWARNSMNAACVVISFAQYMTPGMLREIADYLTGLADDFERRQSR